MFEQQQPVLESYTQQENIKAFEGLNYDSMSQFQSMLDQDYMIREEDDASIKENSLKNYLPKMQELTKLYR